MYFLRRQFECLKHCQWVSVHVCTLWKELHSNGSSCANLLKELQTEKKSLQTTHTVHVYVYVAHLQNMCTTRSTCTHGGGGEGGREFEKVSVKPLRWKYIPSEPTYHVQLPNTLPMYTITQYTTQSWPQKYSWWGTVFATTHPLQNSLAYNSSEQVHVVQQHIPSHTSLMFSSVLSGGPL